MPLVGCGCRNVLELSPNALKRGRNGLKTVRNLVSFRQNEAVVSRKWLVGDGLGLWWIPTISNPCGSQHLRPIMGDDARLRNANTQLGLELRPTSERRKTGW